MERKRKHSGNKAIGNSHHSKSTNQGNNPTLGKRPRAVPRNNKNHTKSRQKLPDQTRLPTLQIGRQSAGFIQRGHPWLRRDRFLGSLDGFQAGDSVTLVTDRGERIASALVDPDAADNIIARVYDNRPDRLFDPSAALFRAAEARARLRRDPQTDCFRLVHGEGDFLPGVRVECYGDCAVLLLRCAAACAHTAALVDGLRTILGHDDIIIREQIDDLRRAPVQARHSSGRALVADREITGLEFDQKYVVMPENDLATGIYVDQRGTRAWLRDQIAQWPQPPRVLNLFAYTGVFSTFALSVGAAAATDMDLAAPALAIATTNAARNGFADRHQVLRGDCLQPSRQHRARTFRYRRM